MTQIKDIIRRQSGFSLVETLISIVLLAIGLSGLHPNGWDTVSDV